MECRAKRIKLNLTVPLPFELCHVDSSVLGMVYLTTRQNSIVFCVVTGAKYCGSLLLAITLITDLVDCVWNVMAHAQKPDFVFLRNGRVYLNWQGRQFSRLLAAELCALSVVMLDTPYSEVLCRVLATHSFRQFPLHFSSRAPPCAITFQLDSNANEYRRLMRNEGKLTRAHRDVKYGECSC